jgi:hypothetical protein
MVAVSLRNAFDRELDAPILEAVREPVVPSDEGLGAEVRWAL